MNRRGVLGLLAGLFAGGVLPCAGKLADAAPIVTKHQDRILVITPPAWFLEFRYGSSVTTYALEPGDVIHNRRMIQRFGENGVLRKDGGEWRLV